MANWALGRADGASMAARFKPPPPLSAEQPHQCPGSGIGRAFRWGRVSEVQTCALPISLAGLGYSATIAADLTCATELVMTDFGTLVLSGANAYTGGTAINGGTLRISNDGNLGAGAGGLSFNGGTLQTTATMSSGRAVSLVGAGTFLTDAGTTLTVSGLISGAGTLAKAGAGTLTLTGDNNHTGGTTITAGTLQRGNGGTTGGISGDVANNATLAFNRSNGLTFDGLISGIGSVNKLGAGTVIFSADNSYTGITTIAAGVLQLGGGGTTGSIAGNVVNNAALAFNRSDENSYSGVISGTGILNQIGTGTTILYAANSYAGATNVNAGTLLVDGNQSAATGLTTVASGATLGGIGTIGGDVNVAAGGALAAGSYDVGTLSVNGSLSLAGTSLLDYEFGQSNIVGGPLNDLVSVGGDLTLDGTIDVTVAPGGDFGVGLYRVISYAGALTDNGLALGTMPVGSTPFVQTAIANQVNLVNTAGLTLNFWDGAGGPKFDGAVNGGDGVWQNNTGNDNWADIDGIVNATYADGAFAIFSAAPGTVTVDNGLGAVSALGMQFASDGYVITGDPLTLMGAQATIRVGDGTAPGAA